MLLWLDFDLVVIEFKDKYSWERYDAIIPLTLG